MPPNAAPFPGATVIIATTASPPRSRIASCSGEAAFSTAFCAVVAGASIRS